MGASSRMSVVRSRGPELVLSDSSAPTRAGMGCVLVQARGRTRRLGVAVGVAEACGSGRCRWLTPWPLLGFGWPVGAAVRCVGAGASGFAIFDTAVRRVRRFGAGFDVAASVALGEADAGAEEGEGAMEGDGAGTVGVAEAVAVGVGVGVAVVVRVGVGVAVLSASGSACAVGCRAAVSSASAEAVAVGGAVPRPRGRRGRGGHCRRLVGGGFGGCSRGTRGRLGRHRGRLFLNAAGHHVGQVFPDGNRPADPGVGCLAGVGCVTGQCRSVPSWSTCLMGTNDQSIGSV